ncbi:MAG: BtpA/SgcQ family protein [Phycisphaerales bacterium]
MLPPRALIGMVHVQALPGSPGARLSIDRIARLAADEAAVIADCGFNGIIVENMHDRPYVQPPHGPETVAAMTLAAHAVRFAAPKLALGIQVLSSGEREALAIALAVGGSFIRCENFVFAHVADEGLMDRAAAGPLLRYRRQIGAAGVRIMCDIKKKHASHALTGDVSLAEAVRAAEFFRADGVIVTGVATGRATSPADVREAREATTLPVLVGSGVTPEQVAPLFDAGADALIVGSSIKRAGKWDRPIDPARCRALARAVKAARR